MNIYIYSTSIYAQAGMFKVGETKGDVNERIKQQDSTSNPEPLKLIKAWHNVNMTDKQIHARLGLHGIYKCRSNREWFKAPSAEALIAAIETIIGVAPKKVDERKIEREIDEIMERLAQRQEERFDRLEREFKPTQRKAEPKAESDASPWFYFQMLIITAGVMSAFKTGNLEAGLVTLAIAGGLQLAKRLAIKCFTI